MANIFPIQKLRNVFVTNNCVIIEQGAIVKDSCVKECFYQKYLKFGFRLKYFVPFFCGAKKSYILATDEWSKNYCHFLWEALSKVIELKKSAPEAILLLPKSYLKIDFVTKSLAAFGFSRDKIKTIPKKSRLFVKDLSFIKTINIETAGYYDFLKFAEVSQTLVSYYQDQLKTNFGERIYISRSDPKKNTMRKIANETELRAMLTKYGVKTVYLEDFSFLDQISIMHHAKFIIAPHGAGITNAMFAKKGCYLFEMVNADWTKTCFAEMCDRMLINYRRFDCLAVDSGKGLWLNEINVNVENLEKELTKFFR